MLNLFSSSNDWLFWYVSHTASFWNSELNIFNLELNVFKIWFKWYIEFVNLVDNYCWQYYNELILLQ